MGVFKWIAGVLGWAAWGPIGAIISYIAVAAIEESLDSSRQIGAGKDYGKDTTSYQTRQQQRQQQYQRQGQDPRQQTPPRSSRTYTGTEQRNSFFVSLIVLSSAVIKADGKTRESEINVLKNFIWRNFGDDAVSDAVKIMNESLAQDINIYAVGEQIKTYMNYSQRLQLFHYLAQIANADGEFHTSEKSVLEVIGRTIGLSSSDVNSVIAMFYKENNSAYEVLGISPSATDDEVKAAYRRMAMKNHPDKVATLGEEVQKAAAEKFREIHQAYESIKKERGMS